MAHPKNQKIPEAFFTVLEAICLGTEKTHIQDAMNDIRENNRWEELFEFLDYPRIFSYKKWQEATKEDIENLVSAYPNFALANQSPNQAK